MTNFKFDKQSNAFTCSSIGGPTRVVSWSKDGILLNSNSYNSSQQIIDTSLAIYENSITMYSVDPGLYSCTVGNSRGNSSMELIIRGK